MTVTLPVEQPHAAALLGGVFDKVVVPATLPCPECDGDGYRTRTVAGFKFEPITGAEWCRVCNHHRPRTPGSVPVSVSPGDRVRVVADTEPPADGTTYTRDRLSAPEWFAAVYDTDDAWLTNTSARWLPLRAGVLVEGTVTAVLPIANFDGADDELLLLGGTSGSQIVPFPVGEWVHVYLDMDGTDWLTYIDGAYVGSDPETIVAAGYLLRLGASTTTTLGAWYGQIAHVAMWNTSDPSRAAILADKGSGLPTVAQRVTDLAYDTANPTGLAT